MIPIIPVIAISIPLPFAMGGAAGRTSYAYGNQDAPNPHHKGGMEKSNRLPDVSAAPGLPDFPAPASIPETPEKAGRLSGRGSIGPRDAACWTDQRSAAVGHRANPEPA